MDRNRILELALEGLYRQKAGIDADIEEIQAELTGTGSAVPQTMLVPSAGTPKGRQRTPAERKAQAQRMREIWKKRKAAAAAASTKTRSMTAARKKALSLAMREVWKKRKAAAKKGKLKAGKAPKQTAKA
jgi:hypothetical protein